LHDWCYLELADLEAGQFNGANDGLWTLGLLIRHRIADDDLAFFTTWCPAGTTIETLVAVEGYRWAIEGRKREKTSSGSITTRADPGMAGIVMCPW
jgi:SRSO17 transposase